MTKKPMDSTAQAARDLAYAWHSGMSSPLYAFASSGLVVSTTDLMIEVGLIDDRDDQAALLSFIHRGLVLDPDTAYRIAPWYRGELR